jgi:hypothetical protein
MTFLNTLVVAACAGLAACTSQPVRYDGVTSSVYEPSRLAAPSAELRTSIASLASRLRALSSSVTAQDAELLASEAHIYPMHLANVWDLSDSPLLHNVQINSGQRELGLCIDWTFAMRERLRFLLSSAAFDWHWGIANEGSALREHSTLVVTAKGAPFASGIVLDPWRNSGRLFWAPVPTDSKYEWKPYIEAQGWTPRPSKL